MYSDCSVIICLGSGRMSFRFLEKHPLPDGVGQITVADFDADGTIDVLFPVCWPPGTCEMDNSIHVLYNVQKPMCSSSFSHSSSCRSQDNLCTADGPGFDADWRGSGPSGMIGTGRHVILPIDVAKFTASSLALPITVRTGDVNMDGFPDLFIALNGGPLNSQDSSSAWHSTPSAELLHLDPPVPFSSHITLWVNVGCSMMNNCTADAVDQGRRTFALREDSALKSIPGAYAAAAVDISDHGVLDLMVLSQDQQGNQHVHALKNNLDLDAFFLTAMSSNGVCSAWCPSGAKFPSPKVWYRSIHLISQPEWMGFSLCLHVVLSYFFVAVRCKRAWCND